MAQTPPVKDMEKVAPDEGALVAGAFESLAGQKVQLDIDDAPFMMPDEPPADLPAKTSASLSTAEEAPKKKRFGKKAVLGLVALLVAAAAAVAVYYFLSLPPPPPEVQPTIVVVPSESTLPATPTELVTTLAPFWVEVTDADGKSRFLVCTFTVGTEDPALNKEIADKIITLRDAIYYYLRGKDYAFLSAPGNAAQLKDDLLAAINNYLVQGELKNLYLNSFLVR